MFKRFPTQNWPTFEEFFFQYRPRFNASLTWQVQLVFKHENVHF